MSEFADGVNAELARRAERIQELEAAIRHLVFLAEDGKVSSHNEHAVEDAADKHPILREVLRRAPR
jgi:hypothetical protein